MRIFALIALCLLACTCYAQKQTENREQTWLGYFNQTRFTNKSGLWLDLHYRLNDNFINEKTISILRLGYMYYLKDNTRLTAGYAYATQYPHNNIGPDVPEHRPWQQVQWFDKRNGYNMMQYFRVEERYRSKVVEGRSTSDYNFNWRFRYNFAATIPLKGKQVAAKVPFLFINDEIHVNAGKRIVNNYFDQNRAFIGFGYQFTSHLNAQVGYLNVFQQLPEGNKYVNINAIRLFVFHNLDFRASNE